MTTVAEDMHTYILLLKPIRGVVFDNGMSLGTKFPDWVLPEVIPPTSCLEAFQPSQLFSQIGHEERTGFLSFRSRFGCFGDTGSYP